MKRFTETQKWEDPWFRKLNPDLKLLWVWLLDRCDNAGIIEPDIDLASFQTGCKFSLDTIAQFGDRVVVLPCGKFFIPKFILFQYGTLSRDCKAHNPIFASLQKHGLKGYPYPMDRVQEKEKEKVQEKETEKEKETPKEKPKKEAKPKPETDPRHKPFIDSWVRGYQFHFGQKYAFNPVDAKQLKAFLGCNPELTESEWLAAAKVGWTLDPQFDKFLADQSKTLKGFVAQFAVLMSKCEVSPAPTQGQKDDDDDDYYARFLRNDAKLEAEIREAEGQPPTAEEIAELEDVL
jgi:hypothetical protein